MHKKFITFYNPETEMIPCLSYIYVFCEIEAMKMNELA